MQWESNPSIEDLRSVGVYDLGDWSHAWIGRAAVQEVHWDDLVMAEVSDLLGCLLRRLGPALILRVVVPGLDNAPANLQTDSQPILCADWIRDESEAWLPRSAATDVGYFKVCFGLEFEAVRDQLEATSWIPPGSALAQACANEMQTGRVFRLGATSLRVSGAMDGTGREFLCFAASASAAADFQSCIKT
jgi:hypothetical protein